MITKINYLLLSTMMITAIDSTFGKCCPCEKDKTKLSDDNNNNKEIIFNINTGSQIPNGEIITNNDDTENLINNETLNDQNIENNDNKSKKNKKPVVRRIVIKKKKKNDKGVNKIFSGGRQKYDENVEGDTEIKNIFLKAIELAKEKNKPRSDCNCKNSSKYKQIPLYIMSIHNKAKSTKYKAEFCICRLKCHVQCLSNKKFKPNETVLLACGHISCKSCTKYLKFCEQCNGYYCESIYGCNNHTLCDNCKSTYICNNKESGGSGECPSCAK